MPRKPNLSFDYTDPAIRALMDDLLGPLFIRESKGEIQEQASFVAELKRKGDHPSVLAFSEIKTHLISAYFNHRPIRLSLKYCIELYDVLIANQEIYGYSDQLAIIQNFQKLYVEKESAITNPDLLIKRLFSNRDKLKYLQGSDWYIYERIGDKPLKGATWGIGVGKVHFMPMGDYTKVEIQLKFGETEWNYEGLTYCDNQMDYLHLNIVLRGDAAKSSVITLRLADNDLEAQRILLGHYSYHSKLYKHLVSKVVVLQRIDNKADELVIGDYLSTDEHYQLININIRRLLFSREMNRLSLPDDIIGNLEELGKFIADKRTAGYEKRLRTEVCGDYFMYHRSDDKRIVEDRLKIYVHEESLEVVCAFTHQIDSSGHIIRNWIGKTYINKLEDCVMLELSIEQTINNETAEDPVLAMFRLPDDTKSIADCDFFPGMVSGVRDANKGPVSYLFLLVRTDPGVKKRISRDSLDKALNQIEPFQLYPKINSFNL